jgi:hypothetical protein
MVERLNQATIDFLAVTDTEMTALEPAIKRAWSISATSPVRPSPTTSASSGTTCCTITTTRNVREPATRFYRNLVAGQPFVPAD